MRNARRLCAACAKCIASAGAHSYNRDMSGPKSKASSRSSKRSSQKTPHRVAPADGGDLAASAPGPLSRGRALIAIALIAVSAAGIFTRLGEYALWDDEANTALFAKSLWDTGDTNAVIGHNIVAYGGGRELKNVDGRLVNRYMPPLTYYITAPMVGLFGDSAFWVRFPLAVFGLATVCVILFWLWRDGASTRMWCIVALAVAGNVSLMLFSRQCRYWSLAMLASVCVAYFYLHWDGRRRTLVAMAIASLVLMGANYMSYLALHVCMATDYLIWHRKTRAVRVKDWSIYLVPQVLVGLPLVMMYMPQKDVGIEFLSNVWFRTKLWMFLWSFRDIGRCEFGVLLLIAAAPVVARVTKNRWLMRGFLAVVLYSAVVALGAPEVLGIGHAPMRLYAPALPLYIALSVLALAALTRKIPRISIIIAAALFLTNIVPYATNVVLGGPAWPQKVGSTLANYVGELRDPPPSAYAALAEWINENVTEGESIWVRPYYAPYPLMFHAPKAVYAWQLTIPPKEKFKGMDKIHFSTIYLPRRVVRYYELPEYIIVLKPIYLRRALAVMKELARSGARYSPVKTLDIHWSQGVQTTRPELYDHRFRPISEFDRRFEAVYIYKRQLPDAASGR